ncbi:hypothetical protein SMD22_00470 (plasmid) [Brevibacillus halotolerans]|nr:hypothetical protein SMD22_00470 [Brevibacillus halotolerans]
MNHVLVEDIHFEWILVPDFFRPIEVYVPQLKDGRVLTRLEYPAPNSVVLKCKGNKLIPILITESDSRLKNFWRWIELDENLQLGKKDSGDGGFFYEPHQKYDVEVVRSVKVASEL